MDLEIKSILIENMLSLEILWSACVCLMFSLLSHLTLFPNDPKYEYKWIPVNENPRKNKCVETPTLVNIQENLVKQKLKQK